MIRLAKFFIERSFIVNLVTGFLILSGIIVATSMKRDLIPQFQWNQVIIKVSLPGATPEEMEKYVTFPIEEVIKGAPGVEKIKSTTSIGYTQIRLNYYAGYDGIEEAASYIESRVNTARSKLPEGIRQISVERSEKNDAFLYYLGFEGLDSENTEHRVFYRNFVKAANNIAGVIHVREGLARRDVYVKLKQQKLDHHGLSISDVRTSLRRSLEFAPIGQTRVGDDKYEVKIEKIADSVEDLRSLPLRTSVYGKTVYLNDVAEVAYENEEVRELELVNGVKGTYAVLMKDLNSDAIELKPIVQSLIGKFNDKAPANVKIVDLLDGPYFIERQLDVLAKNGVVGTILVFLILMLFLNWRTAIMTSLGLPLAYAGALIVLYSMGIKIDLLSIIGMILVIGILVDDAIIVAERYSEQLAQGFSPQESAYRAVKDLLIPVTGTVLTTLVAFAPLILIQSEWSVLLFAVPVVVISALVMSYLESFFVLPNHLAHFVKTPPKGTMNRLVGKIRRGYERLLRGTLRFRYPIFGLVLGLLVLAGWIGATKLKHDFNLRVNAERVNVYAVLKESRSLEETRASIQNIEDYMMSLRGGQVENVVTSIGSVWMNGKVHNGFRYARIRAYLDRTYPYPSEIKARVKAEIEEKMKAMKSEKFEKLVVEISRQGDDEEKKEMISVSISGAEDVDFTKIENAIVGAASELGEVGEYVADEKRYQNSWIFEPNLPALNQYQIDHKVLAQKVRSYFTPDEVIETRISGENTFVYTQFEGVKELSFEQLSKLKILNAAGLSIPLSYLGSWKKSRSLQKIDHINGQRNLSMDFKVGEDSNTTVAKSAMRGKLDELAKNFPTYQINVVDADESGAKAQAWALKVAILCIGGVLFVIALILGSLTQPLIVGLPIPFGLIGILLALYLHNLPLGIMALIGLVGTIGVAVNSSIVMVDQINKLSAGITGRRIPREIFVEGASSRLRAVLLTTLTTLGGVFPMAYSLGGESGFTQPLAFSMGWGLSFATILTLFLLPALLEIREDFLAMGRWVWRKLFGAPDIHEISPTPAAAWSAVSESQPVFDHEVVRPDSSETENRPRH